MRGDVEVASGGYVNAIAPWLFVLVSNKDTLGCLGQVITLIFVRYVHEAFGAEDLEVANRCVTSVELAVWSERMMFGVSSRNTVENIARASTGFFPVVLG